MADYPTDNKALLSTPEHPCAFVNTSSGERSAALFVCDQLKQRFGADNVFDLFPVKGKPPAIEDAKQFIITRKPDLLVVAGGDGTVSLGLDIVDAVRATKLIGPTTAPIAVLPMGTGNDLSRSLGFGGGYKKPLIKPEEQFEEVIEHTFMARPCNIDRFTLSITLEEGTAATTSGGDAGTVDCHQQQRQQQQRQQQAVKESPAALQLPPAAEMGERRSFDEDHYPYSSQEGQAEDQQRHQQQPSSSSPPPPAQSSTDNPKAFSKVFTNYFSIGFDAEVAKQFGDFRDNNPEMCKSRVVNKMWYGCFGCNAMCCSSTLPKKRLSLTLDGKPVKVPSNMKSIVVSNMITYAGGNVLWADSHHKYGTPAVDDGKVEVVALEGVWHMVGVGTKTRSGRKLGQSSSIVLYAPANFTMQYDGEPIAAMGTADQTVKVVIEFQTQSLGTRVPSGKTNDGEQAVPLHSEKEFR